VKRTDRNNFEDADAQHYGIVVAEPKDGQGSNLVESKRLREHGGMVAIPKAQSPYPFGRIRHANETAGIDDCRP